MLKLKSLAVAAALFAAGAAGATTTLNAGSYSVTYDQTTSSFGSISSWFSSGSTVGFEWSVDPSVNVTSVGGAAATATFAIPDFTITVNPGYSLSGAIGASLGNIVYFLNGSGATASVTGTGSVSVDGGATVTQPSTALNQTVVTPSFGYFSGTQLIPAGAFSSVAVTGASITLTASGGSFASIGAQPQNKLKFEFTAQAVPEPETYALMLAGLGAIGMMVRRRQSR